MNGKFTHNLQIALQQSQQFAREFGHNYVGTEHLLLGVVSLHNSAVARLLILSGVDESLIERRIIELVGKGDFHFTKDFDYTPRTKNVIENAVREANRFQHDYVSTEHLMLALLREQNSVAVRILTDANVNPRELSDQIVKLLGAQHTSQDEDSPETPKLDRFCRDLTKAAAQGELGPVISRSKEIERVIQILSRRTKNNPVLIGEPGVGKTAVVEGFAQKIAEGNIPDLLRGKRVLSLDLSGMIAGAKFRGEFEERLKGAIDEIIKSKDVILFIDELHTLVGAGAAEGTMDAANILKPALARGQLQAVGATTLDEYRKYIEKDAALERRFQPVMVGEPTTEEAYEILLGLRDRYEAHHKVKITDNALRSAVRLSDRYITDRYLPDKAIDLMDEAASRVRIHNYTAPPDMREMEEKLSDITRAKNEAIMQQNYEKAAQLRDDEKLARLAMETARNLWEEKREQRELVVDEPEIAQIVSSWVGIPVQQLTEDEANRLLHLEELLHRRIVGQDEAVTAVSKAIRRARAGLKDPKRPIGSFLLLGPTGVGKTELCKAIAEVMFGSEEAMIRIDMSEYMEKFSVSRLVGAPPGYVGYEEGGQLTERVRRKPYSVVLLDEIEKAHPDVFNMLLQIMEDGRLTDGMGRTVNFSNTVLIMTSNVGTATISGSKPVGFGSEQHRDEEAYRNMKSTIMDALKTTFRPEFLNRVDEMIVFKKLTLEDVKKVANLMIEKVIQLIGERHISISVSDEVRDYLAKEGYDENFGARPLRRVIQQHLENALSDEILGGGLVEGDEVEALLEGDKIILRK